MLDCGNKITHQNLFGSVAFGGSHDTQDQHLPWAKHLLGMTKVYLPLIEWRARHAEPIHEPVNRTRPMVDVLYDNGRWPRSVRIDIDCRRTNE